MEILKGADMQWAWRSKQKFNDLASNSNIKLEVKNESKR